MYRVAILGCENSHATTFIDFVINKKAVDDIEFVGVYSNEREAMDNITEKYGIPGAESYDAFVGKVDGIIITARDGKNHYKYAKPYIKSGIPMFIDKPITNESEEAVDFMRDLSSHGVRICGGSCLMHAEYLHELKSMIDARQGELIGGHMSAPMMYENAYGGFPFYAQHLVQMVLTVFGNGVKSLHAFKTSDTITAVFHYDGFNVTAEYKDQRYHYYAAISCKDGIFGKEFSLDGTFEREFMEFHHLLHGAPSQCGYEEFIIPVFVINAIERAIVSGKEEMIGEVSI